MKIYTAQDYSDLSRKAANIVSAQIIMKPDCTLGLATGSTVEGMYAQLIRWYRKGDLDFSGVRTINLDEYRGLAKEHPQSYHAFMRRHLFDQVNLRPDRTFLPDGTASDAAAECQRYNALIAAGGGIDLQVLGLGRNGHIGFNEPGAAFEKETHCVRLTESTLNANARYFENQPGEMPREAITLGIKSIMQSRRILLMVSGSEKADALYQALCGPITPQLPASILQLHQELIVVADRAALSLFGGDLP